MPKKTKREKILAEQRKSQASVFSLKLPQTETVAKANSHTASDFVGKDLKKILLLTTLAITFEAMLYWLIKHNGFV